ncbi:MAG: glycosyltransferase family 39 protein [Nitrospirota bacterium]
MKRTIRGEYIVFFLIVLAGLAARLHDVHYAFHVDEILSVKIASKPLTGVLEEALQDTSHPPLYYFSLYLWINVFGSSEESARLLSVLFSCGFLCLSYMLLRRFVSLWLALGLLSILAFSPLFISLEQPARPYALIALLSTVNLLAFMRVMEEAADEHKRLVVWALSCGLLLCAQYLSALMIALQICFALFYAPSKRLKILLYGSVGSALILPWFIAAFGSALSSGDNPLPQISWISRPTPEDFLWSYFVVFGQIQGVSARWLFILLGMIGTAYIKHLALSKTLPANHLLLFSIGFGLPMVVYALSIWGPQSLFVVRQLIGTKIVFVGTIGLCLSTLPRRLAGCFLLALLIWMSAALPGAFQDNKRVSFRDAAEQIDRKYGSITVVTTEADIGIPLDFYRKAGSVRLWETIAENDGGSRVICRRPDTNSRLLFGEKSCSVIAENERSVQLLFLCKPTNCSDINTKALQSRHTLVAKWQAGLFSNVPQQLFLYEIRSVS